MKKRSQEKKIQKVGQYTERKSPDNRLDDDKLYTHKGAACDAVVIFWGVHGEYPFVAGKRGKLSVFRLLYIMWV